MSTARTPPAATETGELDNGGIHTYHRRRSPSVPRRNRRRDARDREVVVQRVVKEVGGAFPQLTKGNYEDWSLLVKVKLEARGLWEAIEHDDVDHQEDRMALEALLSAVPPEMIRTLAVKKSAKEAWAAIRSLHVGDDRVRKSTLQRLRREWELLGFKEGEAVDDFTLRLSGLMSSLSIYGEMVDEQRAVEKLLRVVPAKYSQIALSIETLLDTAALSVEEVAGRLKAVDDRSELAPPPEEPIVAGGKLYFTEEQWLARAKEGKTGGSKSSPKPPRSNSGGGRNRSRGARKKQSRAPEPKTEGDEKDKCHNCGRYGHWAKDCRKPKQAQANLAQTDEHGDHEPSLLMAQLVSLSPAPTLAASSSPAPTTPFTPANPEYVHLDERQAHVLLGAEGEAGEKPIDGWCVDSGATNHMTGRADVFANMDKRVQGTVKFGDDSLVDIRGIGTVIFSGKGGEHIALDRVFYIPRLRNSIISVGQLDEHGSRVQIKAGWLRIWDQHNRLLAKVQRGRNRLYTLKVEIARPICLSARHNDDAWRWHERFGHLHFDALNKMGRDSMVRGLPKLEHVEQLCETCIVTKHRRAPFPQQAKYRAKKQLELVHGDLCGPISPATPGGRRFFLLLVDDATRYMWVVLLAAKSDAAVAIKRIQAEAEGQCGRKLRVLRTDNGREFTAKDFANYCADEGIVRHFSTPYAPQQNGVVERRNQTVVAMARALLKQRSMPAEFWGEAVSTAVFLLNRAPTKSLIGKTPFEAWHGRKPSAHYLRTFGCLAYVKKQGHLRKLDDRSAPAVFIGYEDGVKAYRLLDPLTRRVCIAREVIFDEDRSWDWASIDGCIGSNSNSSEFIVDFGHTTSSSPMATSPSPMTTSSSPMATSPSPMATSPGPIAASRSPIAASEPMSPAAATTVSSPSTPSPIAAEPEAGPEFVTPRTEDEDRLDATHGESPIRYRTVENLIGTGPPVPGLAQRNFDAELHLASTGEPCSFAEAEQDEAWRAAMKEEIDSIERNRTWELVDLPSGHRPITLKWVYKVKKSETGEAVKNKARLVARGFVQQAGVDFDEVFAPVARMESVRLLLALAAENGWNVHHMDVKSAFLNGDLKEEVYVRQPPGFVVAGREHKVLRLHKALYGLRQAPRAWNQKLDDTLKRLDFHQSEHEHAMYRRGGGDSVLLVGVYVDDLIITGASPSGIKAFKAEMMSMFQMSDLGHLSLYLGIEVHQDGGAITLRQARYAESILELAGMAGCNAVQTPMEERLKLSRSSTAPEVDATHYRRLVGSLRYLIHTRPDLAFAVGFVSRFMEHPTEEHLQAVKRILRYVAGTLTYGLRYERRTGAARLVGYCDSDLAGDVDTRKSTSGTMFFLGKSLISWQSVKQRVVALSSCEAEYVATTTAATQAIWLARLLSELTGEDPMAVELKVDSKSALALAKNPVFHERSKHIDLRYHFIRSCLEEGSISANFIPTSDQLADILTKALGRVKFQELRARIGMVSIT